MYAVHMQEHRHLDNAPDALDLLVRALPFSLSKATTTRIRTGEIRSAAPCAQIRILWGPKASGET